MQTAIGEVKLVIWDWFNTLCDHHLYEDIAENNPPAYEQIQRYFFEHPQHMNDWAQGKLTYQQIHQQFAKLTGLPVATFDESLRLLGSGFDIDQRLLAYLAKFKENGVLQVIATDNFDIWDEFFMPQYSKYIEIYFSGVYNSREQRLSDVTKQQEFLLGIIDSYALSVVETILIDDNEEYAKTFQKIGGQVLTHDTKEDLLQRLEQLFNKE